MDKVLYLTSSSYSGSTLLTFLVNQHPEIFTIGELEGWDYGKEEYRCSCGALIDDCSFFRYVKKDFSRRGLEFSTKNFGTKLQLAHAKRLNRYLTSAIPHIHSSMVEKARDSLLWNLPVLKKRFEVAVDSNKAFIESSLVYHNAQVFVDATKNPFRLRMLNRIREIDLKVIYLVRDIRGVVASNVRKKDISVAAAAQQWLSDQANILRILKDFQGYETLYYEDLCLEPNTKLSQLYSYLGLNDYAFTGNIRESEHHILGNVMRVSDVNEIQLDNRSKTELNEEDLVLIESIAQQFLDSCSNEEVHRVVRYYLDMA